MPSLKLFAAAAAVATFAVSSANAAIVINDGFEYANQAAYDAAWPAVPGVSPNAQLDATRAASGSKSVTVPGTGSNNQYRSRITFADIGAVSSTNSVLWSFDFFDSTPTNTSQRNYANLQDGTAPTGTNQLISMGINNNQLGTASGGNYYMARILGYAPTTVDPDGGPDESVTGSGAYFKLNDFGVGLRSAGWHNLKVFISTDDDNSTDYAFYVDNVLAEVVSNVGTAASLRDLDTIAIGSGLSNASVDAGFDNMFLQSAAVIPEPTSIAALGLAGLAFARRRRA